MNAREACYTDDGLHVWRFGIGRWSGEPAYRCDRCGVAVITFGDEDDYYYLTVELRGRIVIACAGCGEHEDDVNYYPLPIGDVPLCVNCGPDEADALAELAAAKGRE